MRNIALLVLILAVFKSFGQPETVIWKNPDYKDLAMKVSPYNPGDPAMVLEEYGNMYFDDWRGELRLYYDIRRRIKIFTEQGKKYAHYEKVYYAGYDHFEEFAQVKAFIYTVQNGRPVKKRLKKKYIRNIKLEDGYYKLVLDFPEAKPGDIVEYRVVFTTFLFAHPDTWYFQKDIPVRYSEFSATIPNFMIYYFDIQGEDALSKNITQNGFTSIQWTAHYTDPIPSGLYYKGYDVQGSFNYRFPCKFYTFAMRDIPPFEPEPYLDNPDNYKYHIEPLLFALTKDIGYYTDAEIFFWEKFSKRMYVTLSPGYKPMTRSQAENQIYPAAYLIFDAKDWSKLAKQFRKDPDWGIQLKRFVNVQPVLNQITKDKASEIEKTVAIYDWVKQNIKWNGIYEAVPNRPLSKIYEARTGNSSAVNMLLIYMLKRAGIDAYPVLVRTVDQGHLVEQVAAFYQFNHLIAAVHIQNQTFLLDAIKPSPWYELDSNDHNIKGFLIETDTSYFVKLQDPLIHRNSYTATFEINDNSLTGEIKHTLIGRLAQNPRLKGVENNFETDPETQISLKSTDTKPTSVTEIYTINSADLIQRTDSALVIKPMKIFKALNNIFDSYSRLYPVYLFNNKLWDFDITIKTGQPLGDIQQPHFDKVINGARLTLKTQAQDNAYHISVRLKLDDYYFPAGDYYSLYELFENLQKLKNFTIVLPEQ